MTGGANRIPDQGLEGSAAQGEFILLRQLLTDQARHDPAPLMGHRLLVYVPDAIRTVPPSRAPVTRRRPDTTRPHASLTLEDL